MSPEIAKAILEFLRRTELRGYEVDAFIQSVAALQEIAKGPSKEGT